MADFPLGASPSQTRGRRGRSNSIDVHVGGRVRIRRTLLGLSQEKLGEALGLTFQQVQKYERGANRISASRLFQIGRVLDVPVSYFYEEMPDEVAREAPKPAQPGLAETQDRFEHDPLVKRETLELVRAYYRISDPRVRRRAFDLIKAIARAETEEESPPGS